MGRSVRRRHSRCHAPGEQQAGERKPRHPGAHQEQPGLTPGERANVVGQRLDPALLHSVGGVLDLVGELRRHVGDEARLAAVGHRAELRARLLHRAAEPSTLSVELVLELTACIISAFRLCLHFTGGWLACSDVRVLQLRALRDGFVLHCSRGAGLGALSCVDHVVLPDRDHPPIPGHRTAMNRLAAKSLDGVAPSVRE